jgi:hypothetical protein
VSGLDPGLPAIVDRALEKSVERRYPDLEAMRSDLSRVGQRLLAAETSSDLVGRGTVAARGRGRAARRRPVPGRGPLEPVTPSADADLQPSIPSAPHGLDARAGTAAPISGPTAGGAPAGLLDILAAAERDAYEGRLAAAIRRLEAVGPHPDVDAALLHYRQTQAARDAARAQGAAGRAITDVLRAHVSGVRAAITAGRWREAQELLRLLEREVPPPEDALAAPEAARGGPPAGTPLDAMDAPPVEDMEPPTMRRDDEVAHYLSRARRRLEAGDVTAAQSLLDAALDMTRIS